MQAPHVEKMYNEYKDEGFQLVGLTSISFDSLSQVKRFVDYNKLDAPFLLDTAEYKDSQNSVFKKYHAYAGKQYFIDSTGTIVAVYSKIGLTIPRIRTQLGKMGIKGALKGDEVRASSN